MAVAACPAQRALWRMPARSAGTGSCRQDGGLRCPGGAQPHALWAGTTASHRSKLMPLLPPSLPPCFPPAPRTTSVATGEGARGAPGGAGTQVPVTCSRRQLGWRRMGPSSLVSLIPFPCLTGGGSGPRERGNRFLKTTAICKADRAEYLKLLEIVF